jgi:hypothetical protein
MLQGQEIMDQLELSFTKGIPHLKANDRKAVRAYDLSTLADAYAIEYGAPLDVSDFNNAEAYTWLVSTCALP